MKKIYLFKIVFLLFVFTTIGIHSSNAQIGIGTITPSAKSALDITSTTTGVLFPRVTTAQRIAIAPAATDTGLKVYDTTTKSYWYWDGTVWVDQAANNNWKLTGNAGTVPGTNFVGTTDAQNLQLRTNGAQRLTVGATNGNVGVGITAPALTRMEVLSTGTDDALFGHSANVGGILGREVDITLGNPVQTLSGAGVYANNPAAGYTSVYAQSTGAATVAANIAYSDVWMASYNYVQNGSATFNPSASYNQLNVTNGGLAGTQIALRGFNNRAATAGNLGYSVGVQGLANSQNQDSFGVQGYAYSNSNTRAGGYFEALNYGGTSQAYAYVGTSFGGTNRKITGTNSVSEIVPTENHGRVTLTCPESPEYWYQDYGTVNMVNGKAIINLDAILADIIIVDEENPIRVTCTPVGMPYFNGVTIMEQTNKSVEILELNGGSHSGKLQYQLVVKPKTNYGEGRFQQAPGPAYLKADKEPITAKAKNQPNDGRTIYQWPADHIVYKYNPEDYISVGDIVPAGPNAGKIKLGNGKYGEGVPIENPQAKKK